MKNSFLLLSLSVGRTGSVDQDVALPASPKVIFTLVYTICYFPDTFCLQLRGCFPFRQTKQSKTGGLSRKNRKTLITLKQSFQWNRSDPFAFRPTFWLLLRKVGLETGIFGSGTARFGRTGSTGQRGPPLADRIISTRTKAFHLFLDRNFQILAYWKAFQAVVSRSFLQCFWRKDS